MEIYIIVEMFINANALGLWPVYASHLFYR